jgi:hypothetical protein
MKVAGFKKDKQKVARIEFKSHQRRLVFACGFKGVVLESGDRVRSANEDTLASPKLSDYPRLDLEVATRGSNSLRDALV